MKNLNIGDIFYILADCGTLRICKVIKLIKLGDKTRRIIYEHVDDVFPIMTSRHIDVCVNGTDNTVFMAFGETLYTEKNTVLEVLNAAIKNLEEQKKKLNEI